MVEDYPFAPRNFGAVWLRPEMAGLKVRAISQKRAYDRPSRPLLLHDDLAELRPAFETTVRLDDVVEVEDAVDRRDQRARTQDIAGTVRSRRTNDAMGRVTPDRR